MPDGANNVVPRRKTPANLVVLDGVGYALFALGAFFALASHSVHTRVAFLGRFSHTSEIIAGAAVALLGIVLLVVSDKLKRADKHKGTTGAEL